MLQIIQSLYIIGILALLLINFYKNIYLTLFILLLIFEYNFNKNNTLQNPKTNRITD